MNLHTRHHQSSSHLQAFNSTERMEHSEQQTTTPLLSNSLLKYETGLSIFKMKLLSESKNNFICYICDYTCKHIKKYKQHMTTTHPGERYFQCLFCDYSNDHRSRIKSHMITHSQLRPFGCHLCEYKSSRRRSLKLHLQMHEKYEKMQEKETEQDDSPIPVKPRTIMNNHAKATGVFKCYLCEYACKDRKVFKRHLKTLHPGRKMFKCPECEFTCNYTGRLEFHLRIHSDEKPFVCHFCEYKTQIKGNLLTHMERRHKTEFECKFCDFKTNWKTSLNTHEKNLHKRGKKEIGNGTTWADGETGTAQLNIIAEIMK